MIRKYITALWLLALVWTCNPPPLQYSSYTGENYSLSPASEDSSIQSIIAPYKSQLDAEMNRVIGVSAQDMIKGQPESLLGNFVADLVLQTADLKGYTVDFCLLNNGGLRTALPSGDITVGKIFELMPFENEIVILEMQGASVQKLFDYVAGFGGQPIAGASLEISKRTEATTAANITIGESPFQPEKTYYVATSDYLANGGDNMTFFTEATNRMVTGIKLRDAIIYYIEALQSAGKKIEVKYDGRVRQKDE